MSLREIDFYIELLDKVEEEEIIERKLDENDGSD